MFRVVGPLVRAAGTVRGLLASTANSNLETIVTTTNSTLCRCLGSFSSPILQKYELRQPSTLLGPAIAKPILPAVLQPLELQTRTLTKFSLRKGKRKAVKAVLKRFFRLHWGGWIRTRAGRHKKLWKKSPALQRRLRQHVFVNGTQAWLLDKMTSKFWRKPKYYVDDPYAPYHTRNEFRITSKTPFQP